MKYLPQIYLLILLCWSVLAYSQTDRLPASAISTQQQGYLVNPTDTLNRQTWLYYGNKKADRLVRWPELLRTYIVNQLYAKNYADSLATRQKAGAYTRIDSLNQVTAKLAANNIFPDQNNTYTNSAGGSSTNVNGNGVNTYGALTVRPPGSLTKSYGLYINGYTARKDANWVVGYDDDGLFHTRDGSTNFTKVQFAAPRGGTTLLFPAGKNDTLAVKGDLSGYVQKGQLSADTSISNNYAKLSAVDKKQDIGITLYDKSYWTDLIDFTVTGIAPIISSTNGLAFSGGTNDYTNYITLNGLTNNDENVDLDIYFVATTTTGTGPVIGKLAVNNGIYGLTGAAGYNLQNNTLVGPNGNYNSSFTVAAGDYCMMRFSHRGTSMTYTFTDYTQGASARSYFNNFQIATSDLVVFNYAGSFEVKRIRAVTYSARNADLAVITDSKFLVPSTSRIADQLSRLGVVNVFSGQADRSSDLLKAVPYIIKFFKPKIVLTQFLRNDVSAGVNQAVWKSNEAALTAAFTNSGTPVVHMTSIPETIVPDQSAIDNYLKATYPSSYIDASLNFNMPNYLSSDGIHATEGGTRFIADKIINSGFFSLSNRLQVETVTANRSTTAFTNADNFFAIKQTFNAGINASNQPASRALVTNANRDIISSTTTAIELSYLSGVTSPIQTQLNGKTTINGTGYIKANGTAITYDNNTYGPLSTSNTWTGASNQFNSADRTGSALIAGQLNLGNLNTAATGTLTGMFVTSNSGSNASTLWPFNQNLGLVIQSRPNVAVPTTFWGYNSTAAVNNVQGYIEQGTGNWVFGTFVPTTNGGPAGTGYRVSTTNPGTSGYAKFGNFTVGTDGNVTETGTTTIAHLRGGTTAPAITTGAGAGTSPTISISGSDLSGTITLTTGTNPVALGSIAILTFNSTYASAPRKGGAPAAGNAATASLSGSQSPYYTTTTTTLVLNANTTALAPNTTYVWDYTLTQ